MNLIKSLQLLFTITLCVSLTGCMQSKEHLTLNETGAGVLEVNTFIPDGTLRAIDMTLGSINDMLEQAFDGKPVAKNIKKQSVTDHIFNQDELIKKAKAIGLKLEFSQYEQKRTEDGLHIFYVATFDSIYKLLKSKILSADIQFGKDRYKNWICIPKVNKKRQKQNQVYYTQAQTFLESEKYKKLNKRTRKKILKDISNLQYELQLSMPFNLRSVSGDFQKAGDQTARLYIEGDLFEDANILPRLSGNYTTGTNIIWASGYEPVFLDADPVEQPYPVSDVILIRLFLKDGTVKDGELIKQTPGNIHLRMSGEEVIIPKDQTEAVEYH